MIGEGIFLHLEGGITFSEISENMKSIISYRMAVNPVPLNIILLYGSTIRPGVFM